MITTLWGCVVDMVVHCKITSNCNTLVTQDLNVFSCIYNLIIVTNAYLPT